MMGFLPAGLWVLALLWCLGTCAICLISGEFTVKAGSRAHQVQPVSWSVVAMQLVSCIMAVIPYAVYSFANRRYTPHIRGFYTAAGIPSALLLAVLICAELTLMYLQANRAYRDTMDAKIGGHSRNE